MNTEDRLFDQLDQHLKETHDGWELDRETFDHQIMSPVEPCNLCGRKVFLILGKGQIKPVWLQFGNLVGQDTLFPYTKTKRHTCGDGESWSVEAALFVESALKEWSAGLEVEP